LRIRSSRGKGSSSLLPSLKNTIDAPRLPGIGGEEDQKKE
jgi:hypothetical protein